MKKLLSLIMAIAMMASLGVSVLAEGDTPAADPNSMEATGEIAIPTISVTIGGATGAKVFVNPYGFKLKLADASLKALENDDTADTDMTDSKVFSPTYYLQNNTTIGLDVYVNGSGTIKSGSTMSLATDNLIPGSTKKEALIYAAFGSVDVDAQGKTSNFRATTATFSAFDPKTNFLIKTTQPAKAQQVGTLAASTSTTTKGYLGFQFLGDAVSEPNDAWDSTKDGVTVKLIFTYKPTVAANNNG